MKVNDIVLVANDYEYKLVALVNDVVTIRATSLDVNCGGNGHYEVWLLRKSPVSWVKRGMSKVRFPNNEEFGSYGWAYNTLEQCNVKVSELVGC